MTKLLTTTSSDDLEALAKQMSLQYFKIYSTDLLPTRFPAHTNAIINVDRAEGDGTHWVAVHSSVKQKQTIYFDPFGMLPDPVVLQWMKKGKRVTIGITTQLQHADASSCGYWCLYFLQQLEQGVLPAEILSKFSADDQEKNEKTLANLFVK